MADAGLAAGWVLLLVAAVGGGARLRRWGMPAADVRDALHIGAGVWVLGWPLWSAWQVPLLIVTASVVSALMVPALTQRHEWARRLYESVADGDERWSGVSLYIVAFATLYGRRTSLASVPCGGGAFGARVGRRTWERRWPEVRKAPLPGARGTAEESGGQRGRGRRRVLRRTHGRRPLRSATKPPGHRFAGSDGGRCRGHLTSERGQRARLRQRVRRCPVRGACRLSGGIFLARWSHRSNPDCT